MKKGFLLFLFTSSPGYPKTI